MEILNTKTTRQKWNHFGAIVIKSLEQQVPELITFYPYKRILPFNIIVNGIGGQVAINLGRCLRDDLGDLSIGIWNDFYYQKIDNGK